MTGVCRHASFMECCRIKPVGSTGEARIGKHLAFSSAEEKEWLLVIWNSKRRWSNNLEILWYSFRSQPPPECPPNPENCLGPDPELCLSVNRMHLLKEIPWTLHPQPIESNYVLLRGPSSRPKPWLCSSATRIHSYCRGHRCFAALLGSFYVTRPSFGVMGMCHVEMFFLPVLWCLNVQEEQTMHQTL